MQALILAGGIGSRFWPASRRSQPKQLLPLVDGRSLLRSTVDRLLPLIDAGDLWISTSRELAAKVAAEVPEVAPDRIVAEPAGRNTLAAIALALCHIPEDRRDEVVVSFHSDHWIGDEDRFRELVSQCVDEVARLDVISALGVVPESPDTGLGYMQLGNPVQAGSGLLRVERFIEKPDLRTAEEMVAAGNCVWNACIFAFRAETMWQAIRELEPEVAEGVAKAAADAVAAAEVFASLPSLSIDTAVLERLPEMGALPMDCGWSDLGSWDAVARVLRADGRGNAAQGEALYVDAADNVVYSDTGLVALLGVEGLAVVRAGDAVLVLPRERAQEVRQVVAAIERRGRGELLE